MPRTKKDTTVYVVAPAVVAAVFYDAESASTFLATENAKLSEDAPRFVSSKLVVTTAAQFSKLQREAAIATLTPEQRAALKIDRPKKTRKGKKIEATVEMTGGGGAAS